MKRGKALVVGLAFSILLAGCSGGTSGDTPQSEPNTPKSNASEEAKLSGTIEIDGSSTVYPLTEAVAEEFGSEHKDVRVTVGISGTGGGFKRFTTGEIAVSNASRPIKPEEAEDAKANGIEYTELEVAYDGLSVIVNPQNNWVDHLTIAELNEVFKPNSTVKKWSDIRPDWPAEDIKIFSPGADSGTFDYFTEVINGKAQESRNDPQVTFSEDDNTLVQGIGGEKNGLGYFGYAYYEENQDKLKLVPIDSGDGPVAPSPETINDGTYKPLSRPMSIYVNNKELEKPEVNAFINFYLNNAGDLSEEVGYIRLPQEMYDEGLAKLK